MASRGKVCVMSVNIHLPFTQSLKDRRAILNSFKKKAKDKLNILAIESNPSNNFRVAQITLCSLAQSGEEAKRILRNCINFLEENYLVEIMSVEEEVF